MTTAADLEALAQRVERFARRICWLEFPPPRTKKRIGHSEASYWKCIHPDVRQRRIEEAERFLRELRAINGDAIASALLDKALDND